MPIWVCCVWAKIACPPSWVIPTSNEKRVRVDVFWKIIASVFPFSASPHGSGSRLMAIAWSIMWLKASALTSRTLMKCCGIIGCSSC